MERYEMFKYKIEKHKPNMWYYQITFHDFITSQVYDFPSEQDALNAVHKELVESSNDLYNLIMRIRKDVK